MWQNLMKDLIEFKNTEKGLSRKALNFLNNLQKQSELNILILKQ